MTTTPPGPLLARNSFGSLPGATPQPSGTLADDR